MDTPFSADTAVIIIFLVLQWDTSVLKQMNLLLFDQVYHLPRRVLAILLVSLFVFVLSSAHYQQAVVVFFSMVILPIYFYKRSQFFKLLSVEEFSNCSIKLRWTADAYAVIVKWFWGVSVVSLILDKWESFFPNSNLQIWSMILTAISSFGLITCFIFQATSKFSPSGFLTNIKLRRGSWGLKKTILLPIVLGFLFALISVSIVLNRPFQPETPLGEIMSQVDSVWAIGLFLILAIFLAPLIEEIVFRGYFFEVLKLNHGEKFAIIVIASSFGILHMGQYWGDPVAITTVCILGFVLTILRWKSQSILSSVIMHYTYNASVVILPLFVMLVINPPYLKYMIYSSQLNGEAKEVLLLESIQKQPQLADAYNDLAWMYAEGHKNLDKALEYIDRALNLNPKSNVYLDTKAEVLTALGRNMDAQNIREQILKSNPSEKTRQYQEAKIEALKVIK